MNIRPMLQAINLTKRYNGHTLALDKVNFEIYPGEVFCLLGANGAGKTTTINLFLDFIPPSEGEARINGINSHQNPLEAKKYAAYVSENVMLYGNFTARQNLDYFAKLGGKPHLTREEYDRVMGEVGLSSNAFDRRVKEFSKGMRQKVGLAIARIKDSPAILLDEPTSGLDPKAGAEFMELLSKLKADGKAILMSTHDIFRSKDIADRMGIMNEGRMVMQKTREELAHEDLEKLYLSYMEHGPLPGA